MLTMAKKTERDLLELLGTEWGFVSGACKWEGKPINLEAYQLAFLQNRSKFRWVVKSRQVGMSWLMAMEALARCHLRENYTAIFVSFSQDEAKERILAARQVYEDLPLAFQKRLKVDSRTELVFESNSAHKRPSRILSYPSKAPRGKNGDPYLDELAHLLNDRDVYTGTTALISRQGGQLTGCSTPLGRRGIFWEIAEQSMRKYPHHSRQVIPWWLCSHFCSNVTRAAVEAPRLPTEDRIRRFGLPAIVAQYDSLPREEFRQEFEVSFTSELASFYPYELILPCASDEIALAKEFSDVPPSTGRLVAGFDVGRTRDSSELALFEQADDKFICRMLRSYYQAPFAEQETELRRMLQVLPIARLSIDNSGLGMSLAESLARDFPQVFPEVFSNPSKERWANNFKILLQNRKVVLPLDRDLVGQIHSIQRRILPSGHVTFDSEKVTGGGHADQFWAIVLACQKEREQPRSKGATIVARVLG